LLLHQIENSSKKCVLSFVVKHQRDMLEYKVE